MKCSRCDRSGILDKIGNQSLCQNCQYELRQAKRFSVDFDGQAVFTLAELFADGEADQFLTRAEVEAMKLDEVICFGGGAAPTGTITRIR